ncbi:conserved domain protein [Acidobacterium capsulatum ATCC 51196]|uniref:Conserved domain protein n=1 Tax=Acidobacterium capsulatum (strain ATCC 51196 / DSM 11244 / BCRC 80197 / JCM 7670 / NBRC 15755 / NCIMB 13165 / 161) TaxID=240015 RepID=C1F3D4_ACIC5|nr:conserved domain protein [Acidobacterium capsulatum ATCC 51196]
MQHGMSHMDSSTGNRRSENLEARWAEFRGRCPRTLVTGFHCRTVCCSFSKMLPPGSGERVWGDENGGIGFPNWEDALPSSPYGDEGSGEKNCLTLPQPAK